MTAVMIFSDGTGAGAAIASGSPAGIAATPEGANAAVVVADTGLTMDTLPGA